MASPDKSSSKDKQTDLFPVGPAGKRELRRALVRSTDPAGTIQTFQTAHSLHSMMARALGTTSRHDMEQQPDKGNTEKRTPESLDTDSVMTFLSHLGVTQHEVHKRISDTLLQQLQDEIRKTKSDEPLLNLLQQAWLYATTIPELRPVLQAVLKQLGEKTPLAVLKALGERDETGSAMKHVAIFKPLPPLLKRLVWEADWDSRIPLDPDSSPQEYLKQVNDTLLCQTLQPFVKEYENNRMLIINANRPFVATARERRMVTTQRRALTSSSATPSGATITSSVLRPGAPSAPSAPKKNPLTSGRAVAQLRSLLSDTVGTSSSYRPKLLYALLSMLMAQHGALETRGSFLGANRLHCTLVADMLLSAGGSLPKGYQNVHALARVLDEVVQEGNLTDARIVKVQALLRNIFQPDTDGGQPSSPQAKQSSSLSSQPNAVPTSAVKRQLNRIITAGLTAMKEADPQNLFLNPVTDAIAPGYSEIISKPMCIVTMEQKVARSEYNSVNDWELDVKQVFKNCMDYNKNKAGQWFRGEAHRQGKVFREEILPQARRLYQKEILAKQQRSVIDDTAASRKRKAGEEATEIAPLEASSRKRQKKDHQEYLPSMPALAAMLLADPFVVRIVLARILRELRRSVIGGSSLPSAQSVVPSLLQILHMSHWSSQLCAVRGKKYFVPDPGIEPVSNANDPIAITPYYTLRRYLPLLLRLVMDAEVDQRVMMGGDLYDAAQTASLPSSQPLDKELWSHDSQTEVAVSLFEGSLVHICQPGNSNESSLPIVYPKFATALQYLSDSLGDDRAFFICLIQALLRHKTKLSKPTRDAVVEGWLSWLLRDPSDTGTMTCSAHECLIMLLNEWTTMGNQILPRDTLLEFATKAVEAVNESEKDDNRKFSAIYHSDSSAFTPVRKQYERMLKHIPATNAQQWREKVGIEEKAEQKEDEPAKEETEDSKDPAP